MATQAKILSEDDILRKEYSDLVEMNQRLKNICEIYYIGYNGLIYVKSLVQFIEKLLVINDKDFCSKYRGLLCLPNKMFDFKKNAKKSKLIITQTEHNIYLGQSDDPQISLTLNRGIRQDDESISHESVFINEKIIPEFYKKYFEIIRNTDAAGLDFKELNSELVDELSSSKMVVYSENGMYIPLTKHLFLDIKKGDELDIAKVIYKDKGDKSFGKVYYMIRNTTEYYTAYTLVSCISNLSL
jgi:hypothetical protein